MADVLVLVCKICRWRPPNNLDTAILQAHADIEPDHDPTDIRLEMVAWCHRCGLEMTLDTTTHTRAGQRRHRYTCPGCHRSQIITQEADRG